MSGEREDPETSVDDLVLALTGAAQRCPAPHVVVVCPPSPAVLARSEQVERFQRLTRALASRLSGVSGVHVVSSAEIAAVYPVADLHDPHSDRVGHVPYTPLYFAALGTAVVRRLSAILGAPYKVIVLDCDQTLWKGIVGEAAEGGVTVDAPRRALQEWMVAQHERGMLLCLCSKNNEADVLEVFERGPDMPLRREHILAHRINWRPKSENLISLAAELGLGLDSFVFVDDDPLECAEVKARCPDVLTLELPRDPAQIPQVLRHVWAFDHLGTSHEDRQRTVLYRQNAQRERLRGEVPTLQAFVAGLDLRVSMSAMTSEHLERVSQLTQRTNQLNFTTRRRTESDLQQRLSSGELDGLVVEVRDRFGDYGLVGCVLFSATAGALRVDTFLLSCRALGRGVEVQMLARLGGIARERGLLRLEIEYRRSKKNRPALELLERTCGAFQSPIEGEGEGEGGHRFEVPARDAQALDATAYLSRPEIVSPSPSPAPLLVPAEQGRRAFVVPDHVATSLDQAEKVLAKIRSRRRAPTGARMDYVPPRTRAEEALVAIWADMLGVVRVGLDDDFFALGGHSLLAVRVFDRIGKHFGKHLPIATLFQAPTIRQLAGLLTRESWMPSWSSLVPICTTGSRRPFFCVHSLGGNVLNFRLLSRGLGQDQPFYGLQSRGLGGDEAPQESVEQMATAYIEEMRAVQPEGPYAIGGSSSGGVIAYEMAQQLVASGQQVAALVMLDTRWIAAPSARLTRLLTTSPVHPFGVLVDIHLGNLLLRRPRAGLAYLVEKVRGTLGLRPTVETVEPDPFIPQRGLESAIRAITSYVPRPYPGQAAMLLSSDDPGRVIYDRRLAWADLVQGGLTVRFMPGSHDNMLDEPQVDGVAAVVAQCLVGI
jgi:FkbH-like protein